MIAAGGDELQQVNAAIKRCQRLLGVLFMRRHRLGGGTARSAVKAKVKPGVKRRYFYEVNGVEIGLSAREFELLEALSAAPEGEHVAVARALGFYKGNRQWLAVAVSQLNARLAKADAVIVGVKDGRFNLGYRLAQLVEGEDDGGQETRAEYQLGGDAAEGRAA